MTTLPFDAEQFVRDYKSGTEKLTAAYGYNPAEGRPKPWALSLVAATATATASRQAFL